jgi:hypothetical protein
LPKHHVLPPSKVPTHLQEVTLLDNEAVQQGIHEYLAAAKIGEVGPHLFMKHINKIILLALAIGTQKTKIFECTASHWLIKLGYRSCEVRKGLYIDGHKRPNVIKVQETFLEKCHSTAGS